MERLEENSLRWMNIGHASSAVSDFLKKNYITTIHCLHFRMTNNKSLAWKKRRKWSVKEKEWARKQTEREKEEVASLETACLIRKTIVPAQSDIYSEEELSRVEQKYRRRKREREREKWNETRERRQRRARHSSVRLCVSVRHSGYWLLLKAHLAILALALLLHEPSFPLQSRHLISGTSRMISKPEPDTKPPPTPFPFLLLISFPDKEREKKRE
jgi:hypothetical protein